jgi:hypothetical protein
LVLDCYWLAQWYHQPPEHFLALPLSEIEMHIYRTQQIAERRRQYAASDDGN